MPITMAPALFPEGRDLLEDRGTSWLNVLGRLREGVGRGQAQAESNALFAQIARQYPDSHRGENSLTLYPLWRAPNGANAYFSQLMPILGALAAVVLLLACANLANLLLARGVSRQREMAVRLALGAGRRPLVRQQLLESVVLSLAGGGLALLATIWSSAQFMAFAPVSDLPIYVAVNVDRRVLVATLGFSLVTALLFGLFPALRAAAIQPSTVLKEEAGSVAGGRRHGRLASALAVMQIALSVVLLVSAGLFLRSFRAVGRFDPGFNPRGVLLATYDLAPNSYTPASGIAFDRQVLESVRALAGVRAASLADWVPLGFGSRSDSFQPEGYVPGPHEAVNAGVALVSPGYFSTLQIPLLRGRGFAATDSADSAPVAIVSEALAQRYWPGQDAVGKRMKVDGKWRTIVGIARTTDYYDLNEPPAPFIYLPLFQSYVSEVTLHVRTAGDPRGAASAITQAIRQLNANLPVFDVSTLVARTGARTFPLRMAGTFVGIFGALALFLAAIGLYGVIAYAARLRTHEIGLRLALGAQPGEIRRMVLAHGARLAFVGIAIGIPAALGAAQLFRSLLFGVGATDPVTFLGVTALLIFATLAACYFPARRAMRVDPIVALRHE